MKRRGREPQQSTRKLFGDLAWTVVDSAADRCPEGQVGAVEAGAGRVGRVEEQLSVARPGPVFGEVQVDAVVAVGQAGGDVDDLAAQGGAAEQVVCDHRAEQPGPIGTKAPGRQARQGA